MVEVHDLELSGLVLPAGDADLSRDRLLKGEAPSDAYDRGYDFKTLVYDTFHDPEGEQVVLLCPQLLNFEALIHEARFDLDGVPVVPHVQNLSRCSVVLLPCGAKIPQLLQITHPRFGGLLSVGASYLADLARSNALYTISRNNRLEWIQDWLRYYVGVHGADTVVLSDNNSTDYAPADLRAAIAEVEGLRHAVILRARYPFGPTAETKAGYASLYLQRSMAELIRRRFLGRARAVLNVDIDELFHSRSGQSVFDATATDPSGYVRADAQWVYASAPGPDGIYRHRDHGFVSASGKPKANRKWCVAPEGPEAGKQWLTHFINGRKDPVNPDFIMWHCRQISTSWKLDRSANDEAELKPDDDVSEAFARAFRDVPRKRFDPGAKERAEARAKRENMLIITSMKNEGPFILEWIAFHRVIGFNRFLVYTNDCSDGTDDILDRLTEMGVVCHERNHVLRRGPQKSALKYAREHRLAREADWILVSDVDEFLNIKVGGGHVNDLLELLPEADVIPVVWRLFSNDGTVGFEDALMTETFCDAELDVADGGAPRRFAKSLFRQQPGISRFGTHGPIFAKGAMDRVNWILPTGELLTDPETMTRPEGTFGYEVAQMNHYATRSVDAYLVKKDRGRVNHFRQVMGLDYWQRMCLGGERDDSILRLVEATRSEMARLLEDETLATLHRKSVDWYKDKIRELRGQDEYEALRNQILENAD